MSKRAVYSFHEKEIFQDLLKQEKVLTDCSTKRYGGTNASEEENQAWKRIVKSFNSIHGVQKRTMEQLKKIFSNMKQDRKEILRKKRHATGTGGGPAIICTVEDGDLNDDLFDKMIAKPIEGAIDSDLTVVTPESVDDEYSVDDPGISYSEVVVEEEVLVDSTLNTTSEEPHLQPEPLPQPCTSRPTVIQKPESLKRKGTKLPQKLGSRSKVSCEVEAKGNRVLIQQQQDEELHLLLVTMYKAEAELAQFNLQQAKLDAARRTKFEDEKRAIELELLKKQMMD